MLWLGHIALGYLVTKLLVFASNVSFSPQEIRLLLMIGMIASVLPDIDLIPFFIKHRSIKLKKEESHRQIWSHSPLLWIAILSFSILISSMFSPFAFFASIIILAGSLSHFLADTIEYGVFWLWPFSKKKIALRSTHGHRHEHPSSNTSTLRYYTSLLTKIYVKNWTFWVELFVIILAVVVALRT